MTKHDSPVLTVKQVSEYLQVHQSTIYRLLKRGTIPSFRIGSDWRFRKADIDQWLEGLAHGDVKSWT